MHTDGPPPSRSGSAGAAFRTAVRSGSRRVAQRVAVMFASKGEGFLRLAESHAGNVAGDTLVAMALAGTLFFQVPSTQARQNVALYLLITLAPFSVIGPFLGSVFERFPAAYRGGLTISSLLRAVVAFLMLFLIDGLVLFPLAFLLLVLSRFHAISRSSLLPVVLDRPTELIAANAQLARIGVLASAVVVPLGGLGVWLGGSRIPMLLSIVAFVWSSYTARLLPALVLDGADTPGRPKRKWSAPRPIRLAQFATAGVRFLNGFLLLLVAFSLRQEDAGVFDFGALLGAAGLGFFLAAFLTPVLDRYISEEPMVVTALAVEAGSAFIAAQFPGLVSGAALAAAAGLAWGTAKFGFDGLLQATVPHENRGRAFTNSETLFQIAWVLGALIPVIPVISLRFGLIVAGLVALAVQVVYVSAVLVPVAARRRARGDVVGERGDVLDLL